MKRNIVGILALAGLLTSSCMDGFWNVTLLVRLTKRHSLQNPNMPIWLQ